MYEYMLQTRSADELFISCDKTLTTISAKYGVSEPYVYHQEIGFMDTTSILAVSDPKFSSFA